MEGIVHFELTGRVVETVPSPLVRSCPPQCLLEFKITCL